MAKTVFWHVSPTLLPPKEETDCYPGEQSEGSVPTPGTGSVRGRPSESCGYTPTVYLSPPLRPQKTTITTSPQRPQMGPEQEHASPKQLGGFPSFLCKGPRLYLEGRHRVCLHVEARVASLVQGPIVWLLETGQNGHVDTQRWKALASACPLSPSAAAAKSAPFTGTWSATAPLP